MFLLLPLFTIVKYAFNIILFLKRLKIILSFRPFPKRVWGDSTVSILRNTYLGVQIEGAPQLSHQYYSSNQRKVCG